MLTGRALQRPARLALARCQPRSLSFRELDNLANQVARYLLDQGIGSGDRVGLLFDRTIDSYVALLAVLKVNAAYVPLDAGFPTERVRFILQDAGVKSVVSLSAFRAKLDEFAVRQILLDTAEREISAKPKSRLTDAEKAPRSISSPTSSTPRDPPATPRVW